MVVIVCSFPMQMFVSSLDEIVPPLAVQPGKFSSPNVPDSSDQLSTALDSPFQANETPEAGDNKKSPVSHIPAETAVPDLVCPVLPHST